MTKEDFLEWRQHPTTIRVFDEIEDMIRQGMVELSYSAGQDPGSDRQKVGKLDGLRALVGINFYELENENVD